MNRRLLAVNSFLANPAIETWTLKAPELSLNRSLGRLEGTHTILFYRSADAWVLSWLRNHVHTPLENARSKPLDFIKPPKVGKAMRDIRERYCQINVGLIRRLVTRR